LDPGEQPLGVTGFSAALFDWRGTLFHDDSDADWIRASAASIGRPLDDAEVQHLVNQLGIAAEHPQVLAARERADCSAELHQAATLLEFQLAGFDDELALAVWKRDGDLGASRPYSDTPQVLRALKSRGVRIGVISDIHYDLRPHFEHHRLADCIGTFTLSFQHGYQKPDPRLFEIALQALGSRPAETLMVGDRASRDGGAAHVGITTLILPSMPNLSQDQAPRGLNIVLRLVSG
jgi:FMN phosphatase YigB (HAD superfamily)